MFNQGLLFLISLFLPLSATAQVYKWIDQNGKVQYGDRPPSAKMDSEVLKSAPNQALGHSASNSWEEREREFRKRRIQREMQADKESLPVSNHQICLDARYKLQMLDGKVVYRVNEKGERVYMEDTERNAIEAKAKQDIATYCSR